MEENKNFEITPDLFERLDDSDKNAENLPKVHSFSPQQGKPSLLPG